MPNGYRVRIGATLGIAAAIAVSLTLDAGRAFAARSESRVLSTGGETLFGGEPTATLLP